MKGLTSSESCQAHLGIFASLLAHQFGCWNDKLLGSESVYQGTGPPIASAHLGVATRANYGEAWGILDEYIGPVAAVDDPGALQAIRLLLSQSRTRSHTNYYRQSRLDRPYQLSAAFGHALGYPSGHSRRGP